MTEFFFARLGDPNFTTPVIIGGTLPSSALLLESTSAQGTTDFIAFRTGAQVERLRIDSNGLSTFGGFANTSVDGAPAQVQVVKNSSANGNWDFGSIDYGTGGGVGGWFSAYTRGTGPTNHVAVLPGDTVGGVYSYGSDGTAFQECAAIEFHVDPNGTVSSNHVPGLILFRLQGPLNGERFVDPMAAIDSYGGLTLGIQGFYPTGQTVIQGQRSYLQAAFADSRWAATYLQYGNNVNDPSISFVKTRGAGPNNQGAVVNADWIGEVDFAASDGTNILTLARIRTTVTGTVSTGNIPSALIFDTGSNGATERLRIDSNGFVTLGGFANVGVEATPSNLQVLQSNGANWDIVCKTYNGAVSTGIGGFVQALTRATTPTGRAAVAANDVIGWFGFIGDDGSNDVLAANLQVVVDGTVSAGHIPSAFKFLTSPVGGTKTERLRIDSNGSFSLGSGLFFTPYTNVGGGASATGLFSVFSSWQFHALGGNGANMLDWFRWSADAASNEQHYLKSRGATANTHVAVTLNDNLMLLRAGGSDGTAFQEGANINAVVDGTVSAGNVPARLVFSTASASSGGAVERLRIDSNGTLTHNKSGYSRNAASVVINSVDNSFNDHLDFAQYSNDTTFPVVAFIKSRGTTVGANGILQNGDPLGQIVFDANHGSGFLGTAWIQATVDAVPVAGQRVASRLQFATNTTNGGQTEALRINSNGSVMQSLGALATTATDGFLYVNSCAGAPTGAPTAPPGAAVAMVVDTTNSKIWFRIGGVWKGVVVA